MLSTHSTNPTLETSWIPANTSINLGGENFASSVDALDAGLRHLKEIAPLSPAELGAFDAIRTPLLMWLIAEISGLAGSELRIPPHGWCWRRFRTNSKLRSGLLILPEGGVIPIHDHPGARGLLVVLAGHLRLTHYRVEDAPVAPRQPGVCQLRQTSCTALTPFSYALFTCDQGNLHELHSCTKRVLLLDLLFSPYKEAHRSWYLPIRPGNCDTGSLIETLRLNRDKQFNKPNG